MWTEFYIPNWSGDEKWVDYRVEIPGNSETWSWTQPLSKFEGVVVHHSAGPDNQHPDSIAKYHVQVRGWCFPLWTEILTNRGWKNYHEFDLENHLVATYDSGEISFERAKSIVFNELQETARVRTLNADLEFSLNHRVYTGSGTSSSFKVREWGDELKQRRGNVVCKVAGEYQGTIKPKFSKEIYALAASIAADGWFYKKNGKVNGIGFDFAKKREADFLLALLENAKIEYTQPTKEGYFRFRIKKESIVPFLEILDKDKTLPFELVHLPKDFRRAILEAYIVHDGWNNQHGERGREQDRYQYLVSTNKKNIDTLQAIAISLGVRATLTAVQREPPRKTIYRLSLVDKDEVTVDLREREISYAFQPTWDVALGGKLIFVRNNGKVSVTHNSGIGYHFLVDKDGKIWYVGDVGTGRAHVANLNDKYIGVCLIGSFMDGRQPTEVQLQATHALCKELVEIDTRFSGINKSGWGGVKQHRWLSATACPGSTADLWWNKIMKFEPEGTITRRDAITAVYKGIYKRDPSKDELDRWDASRKGIDECASELLASLEHNDKIKALNDEIKALNDKIQGLQDETKNLIDAKIEAVKEKREMKIQLQTVVTEGERVVRELNLLANSKEYRIGKFLVGLFTKIPFVKGGVN